MKWDATRRVYVNDRGREIPASDLREYIDDYIVSNQQEVDRKTEELLAGAITVGVFFLFMRELLQSMHGTAGILAYGGEDNVNWDRIRDKLNSELSYLEGFEAQVLRSQLATESLAADAAALIARNAEVPAGLEAVVEEKVAQALIAGTSTDEAIAGAIADSVGKETAEQIAASVAGDVLDTRMADLIWGQVGSRARMYPESVYATYENSVKDRETGAGAIGVRRVTEEDKDVCDPCEQAATDEYVGMDEITDIGTDCEGMSNCRCHYEFSYLNVEPLEIDREIYA